MDLYISAGSPFARIARIVALELVVEHRIVEETGFPPQKVAAVNPAMQVPTLVDGQRRLFGTRLIVDYLLETTPASNEAAEPAFARTAIRAEHRWRDAQLLSALEALLNGLVLRSYLIWSGAEHRADAKIPMNLREREEERAGRLLDWLEAEATPEGFVPGVFSVQDAWLIVTLDWTDARIGFAREGRPKLEAILARFAKRPSVAGTVPPPWS